MSKNWLCARMVHAWHSMVPYCVYTGKCTVDSLLDSCTFHMQKTLRTPMLVQYEAECCDVQWVGTLCIQCGCGVAVHNMASPKGVVSRAQTMACGLHYIALHCTARRWVHDFRSLARTEKHLWQDRHNHLRDTVLYRKSGAMQRWPFHFLWHSPSFDIMHPEA